MYDPMIDSREGFDAATEAEYARDVMLEQQELEDYDETDEAYGYYGYDDGYDGYYE